MKFLNTPPEEEHSTEKKSSFHLVWYKLIRTWNYITEYGRTVQLGPKNVFKTLFIHKIEENQINETIFCENWNGKQ